MLILDFSTSRGRPDFWPTSTPAAKAKDFELWEQARGEGQAAYRYRGRS